MWRTQLANGNHSYSESAVWVRRKISLLQTCSSCLLISTAPASFSVSVTNGILIDTYSQLLSLPFNSIIPTESRHKTQFLTHSVLAMEYLSHKY